MALVLTKKEQEILDVLLRAAEGKDVEIVTVQVVGGKKSPVIRVFIDTDHGVGFDELSAAQEWINHTMDKLDPFPGAYTLEVSSPGIDRPLRTLEHFQRFAGDTAVIKMAKPVEGRSSWTGIIQGVEGSDVLLELEGQRVVLPFEGMKSAHIKGIIDFSSTRSDQYR